MPYIAAVLFGAGVGAYVFGTANMYFSGLLEPARSVEGALAGGIIAVEIYKRIAGIRTRTGARFAAPLAVAIAIGRIGCFLAGLEDLTYGTPTTFPGAHDFGDRISAPSGAALRGVRWWCSCVFYFCACCRRTRYDAADNGFYSFCRGLRRRNGSYGSSSNPTARSSARSTCFT